MKECYYHGRHFGPSCPDCAIAIKELGTLRAKLDEVRAAIERDPDDHHAGCVRCYRVARIVGEP